MANELVPQIPGYLQEYAGQQNTDIDSAISGAISIPRVSLRGRVFRFIEGGDEVFRSTDPVDVVIYGVEPEPGRFVKTFYLAKYSGTDNTPPDCASDDGVKPSAWIQNPQAPLCATCPNNQFGSASGRNNKPSKACKDAKRIWLSRVGDPRNPPLLYGLNVTVISLRAFADYGKKLKANNIPLSLAITRLTMQDADVPQLGFDCSGFVPQETAKPNLERAKAREWATFSGQVATAALAETATPLTLPQQIPDHIRAAAAAENPTAGNSEKPTAEPNVKDLLSNW